MQNNLRDNEIPMEGSPTPLILLVCGIIMFGLVVILFFDYQKNKRLMAEFEAKKKLVEQLRAKKQVCRSI